MFTFGSILPLHLVYYNLESHKTFKDKASTLLSNLSHVMNNSYFALMCVALNIRVSAYLNGLSLLGGIVTSLAHMPSSNKNPFVYKYHISFGA